MAGQTDQANASTGVVAMHAPMPEERAGLFAVTDQLGGRIVVLDSAMIAPLSERAPAGIVWTWSPPQEILAGRSSAWGRPSDLRLSRDDRGELCLLVTDSYGLVAAIGADGRTRWWVDVGPYANPHAAELLPDGRVAVAASSGGWVRVYSGLRTDEADYDHIPLDDAHGLVWDVDRECLWALGVDRLLSLRLRPPQSAKRGRSVRVLSDVRLPTWGGHDLQPVRVDRHRLWVTTSSAVYQYSKIHKSWLADYDNAAVIDKPNVKSIGCLPQVGTVLRTIPDPDAQPEWLTGHVDVVGARTDVIPVPGQIYKARPWCSTHR